MKIIKITMIILIFVNLVSCTSKSNNTDTIVSSTVPETVVNTTIPSSTSTYVDSSSETSNSQQVDTTERNYIGTEGDIDVIKEYKGDLDNDGKTERLILGDEHGKEIMGIDGVPDYTVILLFQIEGKNQKLIFDSRKTTAHIAGMKIHKAKGEFITHEDMCNTAESNSYFECADYNKNGYPEYYFCNQGYPSVPGFILILEKREDKAKILFDNWLVSYNYEDVDNDGVTEMYGVTDYGYAQTNWFGWAKIGVYDLVNDKYILSADKIKSYHAKHARLLESKIENGDIDKEILLTLLIDYSFTGNKAEGENLINQYFDLIYNSNNYMQYMENYEQMTKKQCLDQFIKAFNNAIDNN